MNTTENFSLPLLVLAVLFSAAPALPAEREVRLPPGYSLETIEPPAGVRMEVGGLAFTVDGTLLICTRIGDVWAYRPGPRGGEWRLFADGLHEPLGIWIDRETGAIYVGQRTEITELIDETGDGVADFYRNAGSGWEYSGNYHEYAFGPVRDSEGNFFMTLNLGHSGYHRGVHGSIMSRLAPYRGWAVKIASDGELVPFASGFRSPAGLGINRKDEVFVTDNQGDWVATSTLFHLQRDNFYGHPSTLADHSDFAGRDLEEISAKDFDRIRTPPAVWFPHRELADSPGEVTFNYTNGKFGPFEEQIFVGDHNRANVTRIVLERIGGEYQGAAFEFMRGLKSGCVRTVFGPDGSLWLGQVDHGWGNIGGEPFALQRLVWDGEIVPFEIEAIRLRQNGFRVTFTKPVDENFAEDISNYAVTYWHYKYQVDYGSPKIDETEVALEGVTVSDGGRTIDLKLPSLQTGKVYELAMPHIRSATGDSLTNAKGWYTLNRLRE